jgi:hypothetical protein
MDIDEAVLSRLAFALANQRREANIHRGSGQILKKFFPLSILFDSADAAGLSWPHSRSLPARLMISSRSFPNSGDLLRRASSRHDHGRHPASPTPLR